MKPYHRLKIWWYSILLADELEEIRERHDAMIEMQEKKGEKFGGRRRNRRARSRSQKRRRFDDTRSVARVNRNATGSSADQARLLIDSGHYETAIEVLTNFLSRDRTNTDALYQLGRACMCALVLSINLLHCVRALAPCLLPVDGMLMRAPFCR